MRLGTAIAANAVLAVAWIVATPPVVEKALAPAPEMRAFFTVHIPRNIGCHWDAAPPLDPAPVRSLRFDRHAKQSLRGILANEAFLHPAVEDPPIIYIDAADDVSWGEVMASIDLVRGKVAPETLLVIPGTR